jgi:hypothetical protein
MHTDCSWPLCPLSPSSTTSTLYCERWLTGQSGSKPSRHMQPTFWASIPTSSHIPTFDPSLATSKGTRTERARMMAWEGNQSTPLLPHHHTPNALLPMPCNPFTLLTNSTLLNNFYHPTPGLGFHPYPYPMANGFHPSPSPAVAPAPAYSPSDKKGNRQKGNKKDNKGQTLPKAKTGTPSSNLPRTSLSRPSKLHFIATSMMAG